MALHTGIPITNIGQPGAAAVPQVTRQFISDLQILKRNFWKEYVQKYGEQDYFMWLSTFAGMEKTTNRDYYWYEDIGKLMLSAATTGAVTQGSLGANVVLTLSADSHFTLNGVNYSPVRAGETIRLASSDLEGKILSVSKVTNNAHTITVRPNRADVVFASAGGSGTIVSGEVLKLAGNMDAGEASGDIDTQIDRDDKITNYIAVMRDTFSSTDLSEMEEVEYNPVGGDVPIPTGGIVSAYTLKAMMKWNKRYLNNCSEKLMYGDLINNTGLAAAAAGTQGLLPAILARGGTTGYTGGAMTIANIHTMLRYQAIQGSAKQIQWLQDIYQNTDFNDALFAAYGAGAFVYGTGSASKEASVAYGFREFFIDDTLLQVTTYPFNTEVTRGRTPAIDKYRDFGILIPQGKTQSKGKTIDNLTVMYQEPPKIEAPSGSVGNGIRVWRHGGGSPNATNGTLTDTVSMVCYKGLRAAAMNQFQTVVGV